MQSDRSAQPPSAHADQVWSVSLEFQCSSAAAAVFRQFNTSCASSSSATADIVAATIVHSLLLVRDATRQRRHSRHSVERDKPDVCESAIKLMWTLDGN